MRKFDWKERILGMRAVEKRFLTEKQFTICLNAIEFEPNKTLQEVLLEKGYLTKNQIKRLSEELEEATTVSDKEKESNKKLFGEMAIQQSMITEEQLSEALNEQNSYLERGLRVQIGQILCKKNYMTLAQVKRIVQSQLKKMLYCKSCNTTVLVHNYDPASIYACEKCKLDLIPAPTQKTVQAKVESAKKAEKENKEEDDVNDKEDGDLNLDILEL